MKLKFIIKVYKERLSRLFHQLGEAWHSFKYDEVTWAHQDVTDEQASPERIVELEGYRNFPIGRDFMIDIVFGNIWQAKDSGGNTYWLNSSNNRWICVNGDDMDLPRNKFGDTIGNMHVIPDDVSDRNASLEESKQVLMKSVMRHDDLDSIIATDPRIPDHVDFIVEDDGYFTFNHAKALRDKQRRQQHEE